MELTTENKRLQKVRKEEIPQVIAEYKKLYDGILKQVGTDFPVFKNIPKLDKDNIEIGTTLAEEQLYHFMQMREHAVDHADRILIKINNLEIELNAPEVLATALGETTSLVEAPKRNWTKKVAAEKKL